MLKLLMEIQCDLSYQTLTTASLLLCLFFSPFPDDKGEEIPPLKERRVC